MKRLLTSIIVITCLSIPITCFSDGRDILKQGLLGAGAGAVGGAASGASGGELWKGALAGAGVNVVGGAVLDTLTEAPSAREPVYVESPSRVIYVEEPVRATRKVYTTENSDYIRGFKDGFSAGYEKAMEGM